MKPSPTLERQATETPVLLKASSPAPQKEKPLQYTDDLGSILAREKAHDTETVKELSSEEKTERLECENMMQEAARAGCKSAFLMGLALMKILKGRLYRDKYPTFDKYSTEELKFKRVRAYQLISHAKDMLEFRDKFLQTMPEKSVEEVTNLLPATETQTRALKGLDLDQKFEVWVASSEGKPTDKVTAEYVKEVRMEKFPTKKKERKAKAPESEDPIHVVASVTDGKIAIVTEPGKAQEGFKIELTVKPGSLKETRAALRRLAGKELSAALNKAA
jgi:hypothetical protein